MIVLALVLAVSPSASVVPAARTRSVAARLARRKAPAHPFCAGEAQKGAVAVAVPRDGAVWTGSYCRVLPG